jgi:arylsulfatase A-like enzyme
MDTRPNLLFVICDDLAYADLSIHGNPHLRTPRLDALAEQSARLNRCCSGPLCTPARAAIMTGRHPQRTGAFDTYVGRSMLHHDEITLAQMLKSAGYDTGLFGKWHLGDCYPMRPCDKGFDESLWHRGGGLVQYGNVDYFERSDRYFDPLLTRNGDLVQSKGYCTDVFTDAAIDWIKDRPTGQPWFAYVAYNAPHVPLEIGEEWVEPISKDLPEKWRKLYGMVANIDHNVGRLLDTLESRGEADNTIVVFTSDHGVCPGTLHEGQCRFNAGFRGNKGTMYEGGIRVPCFVRWADRVEPQQVDTLAHPIDWVPTFASACGYALPTDRAIDGIDLLPLLSAGTEPANRAIPMQWHRGDVPRRYENACVITQRWKWYRPAANAPDELYDIPADPGEQHNVAADHPQLVADFVAQYDTWFDQMARERPDVYAPPRIVVGHESSPTTHLTIQDGRLLGTFESWGTMCACYWQIDVSQEGKYRFDIHTGDAPSGTTWHLRCGRSQATLVIEGKRHHIELDLIAGPQTVTCLSYGPVENRRPQQPDPGVRTAGQIAITRV